MTVTSGQLSHRGHAEAAEGQTCVLALSIRLQLMKKEQSDWTERAPGLCT